MSRHEHVVQLYASDDHDLTRNVARFLTGGFARGEGLLLVATPAHTDAIVSGLAERGIEILDRARYYHDFRPSAA